MYQHAMCDVVVVARFTEDVRWIQASTNHTTRLLIYDKSSGNYGRESVSYLRFILENIRSDLEDDHLACFTQGSLTGAQTRSKQVTFPPRSQDPYVPLFRSIRRKFRPDGWPDDRLPCMGAIARSVNLTTPREASLGAYFRTSMRSLRAIPSEVWWHLYHIHFTLPPPCRVPWTMERLWESLLTQRPRLDEGAMRELMAHSSGYSARHSASPSSPA